MSTEYPIIDSPPWGMKVVTHGGGLDLDVDADEGYVTIAQGLSPRELTAIAFKMVSAAMFNDYSGEGCTIDVPAFKAWLHEQVEAL